MAAWSFLSGAAPAAANNGWNVPLSRNPYAQQVDMMSGNPVYVARTGGDLLSAYNWDNAQGARQNSLVNAMTGGGTSTGTTGDATNPFSTLRNPKNPAIDSATSSLLSQITGLPTNVQTNQNVVKATVKNPALQSQVDAAGAQNALDTSNAQQSLKDFTAAWLAGQSTATGNASQEAAAIGKVYDTGAGGLQAMLDKIAQDRATSTTQSAQRAMRQAITQGNAARMTQPNSAYLQAIINSQVGGIASQTAQQRAEDNRANLLAVLQAQSGMAGQRNSILDAATQRMLVPTQAAQTISTNNMGRLGSLLQLDQANTNYQIDSPEMMLARRLGLLQDVNKLDLGNTFYGVQKPYEASTAGILPVSRQFQGGGQQGQGGGGYSNLGQYDRNQVVNPTGGTGAAGFDPQNPKTWNQPTPTGPQYDSTGRTSNPIGLFPDGSLMYNTYNGLAPGQNNPLLNTQSSDNANQWGTGNLQDAGNGWLVNYLTGQTVQPSSGLDAYSQYLNFLE